jgi:hypothetical protein
VGARRNINSDGTRRGPVSELLAYWPETAASSGLEATGS